MEGDSPSCQVQHNATNPNGQTSTMAGTTGVFNPPNSELNNTKNIQITPGTNMGAKQLER